MARNDAPRRISILPVQANTPMDAGTDAHSPQGFLQVVNGWWPRMGAIQKRGYFDYRAETATSISAALGSVLVAPTKSLNTVYPRWSTTAGTDTTRRGHFMPCTQKRRRPGTSKPASDVEMALITKADSTAGVPTRAACYYRTARASDYVDVSYFDYDSSATLRSSGGALDIGATSATTTPKYLRPFFDSSGNPAVAAVDSTTQNIDTLYYSESSDSYVTSTNAVNANTSGGFDVIGNPGPASTGLGTPIMAYVDGATGDIKVIKSGSSTVSITPAQQALNVCLVRVGTGSGKEVLVAWVERNSGTGAHRIMIAHTDFTTTSASVEVASAASLSGFAVRNMGICYISSASKFVITATVYTGVAATITGSKTSYWYGTLTAGVPAAVGTGTVCQRGIAVSYPIHAPSGLFPSSIQYDVFVWVFSSYRESISASSPLNKVGGTFALVRVPSGEGGPNNDLTAIACRGVATWDDYVGQTESATVPSKLIRWDPRDTSDSDTYRIALPRIGSVGINSKGGVTVSTTPEVVEITLPATSIPSVSLGNTLVIGGGSTHLWDSGFTSPVGFVSSPGVIRYATGVGGNLTAGETYTLYAVYERRAPGGARILSRPSPALVLTPASTTTHGFYPYPDVTSDYDLKLYRTDNLLSLPYLRETQPYENIGTVMNSTTTSQGEILYTAFGEQSTAIVPSASVLFVHDGRVWCVDYDDEESTLYYSKRVLGGGAPLFTDSQFVRIDHEGGKIVAGVSMMGRAVILKEKAVYVIDGDGFENVLTGSSNYNKPIRRAAAIGCAGAHTVANAGEKVVWQGSDGVIVAMDASMAIDVIGSQVMHYTDTLNIVRAVSDPDRQLVYFLMDGTINDDGVATVSGERVILVYDWAGNRWSVWRTQGSPTDACFYNGYLYMLTSSGWLYGPIDGTPGTGYRDDLAAASTQSSTDPQTNITTQIDTYRGLPMIIDTGYNALFGQGARGQIDDITIIGYGDSLNTNTVPVKVALAYDYETGASEVQDLTPGDWVESQAEYFVTKLATPGDSNGFVLKFKPSRQYCTAIRIMIWSEDSYSLTYQDDGLGGPLVLTTTTNHMSGAWAITSVSVAVRPMEGSANVSDSRKGS